MEINLKESSWARASKDTEGFRQNSKVWFWGVEVVGSGAIAGFTAWMLWDRTTLKGWQVGLITCAFFVGLLFLIYLFIFLWNLFRAPYKQRNEARDLLSAKPKPIQLSNRKELISTIHQVKETASEVILTSAMLGQLHEIGKEPPQQFVVDFSNAFEKYREALNKLECEALIAGETFHEPINLFFKTINSCIQKPAPPVKQPNSTVVCVNNEENTNKLNDAMNEVVKEIDEINRLASHKESLQS